MAFVPQLTARQVLRVDALAIRGAGIPSLVLMENAGAAVARAVLDILKRTRNSSVAILCGVGNNGGDGLVAARHLLNAGVRTRVGLAGKLDQLKDDPLLHYTVLKRTGCFMSVITGAKDARKFLVGDGVVVDALFGVGLNRAVSGLMKDVVETVNASGRYVVSVDVPSGLDATTGEVLGAAVRARATVTFTCPKTGLFRAQGPRHAGRVLVADIGIPRQFIRKVGHGRQ